METFARSRGPTANIRSWITSNSRLPSKPGVPLEWNQARAIFFPRAEIEFMDTHERPAGVPPPIRIRPGYGLWTGVAMAVCVVGLVTGLLYPQIAAPTGLAMAALTWLVRRYAGSILAVVIDLLGAIVLIVLCAMVVDVCWLAWKRHLDPPVWDPSMPYPPSLYEKSCCRGAIDPETDASTDNCLQRCDSIEQDGRQRPTP
jgi:hypothetical protein